ncbi:hypothetical protein KA405_05340 [Patescibacteria group bacterium]|nr:hypothetical protein [Patescibacteria group bacterium]
MTSLTPGRASRGHSIHRKHHHARYAVVVVQEGILVGCGDSSFASLILFCNSSSVRHQIRLLIIVPSGFMRT